METQATRATTDEDAGGWVTAEVGAGGFRTGIATRGHSLVADEPASVGGGDEGPTPYEYLLGAMGGCAAMTMRMYATRKGWPLEGARVRLRAARSHEKDCERCPDEAVGITRVERSIELDGPLTEEQRQRLMQIANRCPVKQTLERGIRIEDVAGGA